MYMCATVKWMVMYMCATVKWTDMYICATVKWTVMYMCATVKWTVMYICAKVKWTVMYMRVMGINFVSVSTIYRFDFGTGQTFWYFFLLSLYCFVSIFLTYFSRLYLAYQCALKMW
jgi:hypothetical protein